MRATALILALLPLPALAEQAMTGAEFDAYSQGKTLFYATGGQSYGAEQYLPDHRVVWAFLGDECRRGTWYETGENICFVYDDTPDAPQCWTFYQGAGGLSARFQGDAPGSELVEVNQSPEPLVCPGPQVGV